VGAVVPTAIMIIAANIAAPTNNLLQHCFVLALPEIT
jgi:hypothetical protein